MTRNDLSAEQKALLKAEREALFFKLLQQRGVIGTESEWRFHPSRKWRFDFAWPSKKLALEVEGGAWTNGRHNRGNGFVNDMEKYSEAAALGWRLLRVTPERLTDLHTIDLIQRALTIS